MQLPKVSYPTFMIEVPPQSRKLPFRPMLVKEEKLLLMAKESEDPTNILTTIKQVVNNCCLDQSFQIDMLPLFALEYLFIQLRSASVGEIINVSYKDYGDNESYRFEVNLKNVNIKYPDPAPSMRVEINQHAGIVLKYPAAALYDDKAFLQADGEEAFYTLILKCIDQVYDNDSVYNGADFDDKALAEFIELLDIKSFDKIRQFMLNLPTLYYKIEYKNKLDEEKVIELQTLSDFFTLR